jgi:hypothetical protein
LETLAQFANGSMAAISSSPRRKVEIRIFMSSED